MIRYTQGNLLDADVDALVNTVNTVGVMGKGIALMFKEAFPENYKVYSQMDCQLSHQETLAATNENGMGGRRTQGVGSLHSGESSEICRHTTFG